MSALVYYISLPILLFFSVLPMKILYFFSDSLFFPLLFHAVKYRRKVVQKNLKNAFPEKTANELVEIERGFYHHLADLFVEIIKGFSITRSELISRIKIDDDDLLQKMYDDNQSLILTVGHFSNYEWGCIALPNTTKHEVYVPYRKMANKYFDKLFKKSRSGLGVNLFYTYQTDEVLKKIPESRPYIIGLANDQSAQPDKSFWVRFLNQDTSFFIGTEKIARERNLPVVFGRILKKGRGKFQMKYDIITINPEEESEGYIMQKHAEFLEKDIQNYPFYWLWTHKRWKHKMPDGVDYGFNVKK